MRVIRLSEWELYRDRKNSINYLSKDKKFMLKIIPLENPENIEDFYKEKEISDNLKSLGIPTTDVIDVVEIEETRRHGIVYTFIEDKISVSRGISEDFSLANYYIEQFVDAENIVHSKKDNNHLFPNIIDSIKKSLVTFPNLLTKKQVETIEKFLKTLNEDDTVIHVDANFSNVIVSKKEGSFIIDTGMVARGSPLFDFGTLYCFTNDFVEPMPDKMFHMTADQVSSLWKIYLKTAFNFEDEDEIKAFERKIKPYGLCCLISHLTFTNFTMWAEVIINEKFDEYFVDYL